uniref:Uncharacterized protein n=1 Tax=Trichobilharzia regenti TaxID=157069 RepID=A0AA85JQU0_TRIRE|nr:unnamed protein product [Trichobilharzia regenti]
MIKSSSLANGYSVSFGLLPCRATILINELPETVSLLLLKETNVTVAYCSRFVQTVSTKGGPYPTDLFSPSRKESKCHLILENTQIKIALHSSLSTLNLRQLFAYPTHSSDAKFEVFLE